MPQCRNRILLVGQLYQDTILHVGRFPDQDTKIRAKDVQQRTGGNTCNTAKVLAQFGDINVCYMSAAGSRESSSHIFESLQEQHIETNGTIIYRKDKMLPFSVIIHNEESGSRTIVSSNDLPDLTCEEFVQVFTKINKHNQWWVHFEGRNIDETVKQIDWLDRKASEERWRNDLTISVEVEKPERENIDLLIERGDVVFFSKLYAQHHQFTDALSFLSESPLLQLKLKPSAIAFCTDGSKGASALYNQTKQAYQTIPPFMEKVVDTVGAGDTFNAGIILHLSQNTLQIEDALKFACRLATRKVAQQGFEHLVTNCSDHDTSLDA
ncbi:Ribokinase-like protein [Parasitella parasitica]|nr:Ribokinase-like protein [Parasitella parasitica]